MTTCGFTERPPQRRAPINNEDDPLSNLDGVPAPARVVAPATPSVAEIIALGKAREAWMKTLEATTLPKTLPIKRAAVSALVTFLGHLKTLDTVTRLDLARFYQHLRDGGASTPTLFNKQSYLGGAHGFFAWAQASGHYPAGDNPAAGHIHCAWAGRRPPSPSLWNPDAIQGHTHVDCRVQAQWQPG